MCADFWVSRIPLLIFSFQSVGNLLLQIPTNVCRRPVKMADRAQMSWMGTHAHVDRDIMELAVKMVLKYISLKSLASSIMCIITMYTIFNMARKKNNRPKKPCDKSLHVHVYCMLCMSARYHSRICGVPTISPLFWTCLCSNCWDQISRAYRLFSRLYT